VRVVGREAGLLSYLHFAMFAVTATTMPSLHPLLQVLGRGEAPNRGCRPRVWTWMREDRSRPGLVRLGGRDGGLVLLGLVMCPADVAAGLGHWHVRGADEGVRREGGAGFWLSQ